MGVVQECGHKIQKLANRATDGKGLLQLWWMALEGDELLMALTVARLIWLRCNDLVFGRGFSPRKFGSSGY